MFNNFKTLVLEATPVLDTAETAAGDVLCPTLALTPSLAGQVFEGEIVGLTVLDTDDNGAELDVFFLEDDTALGTAGAAISISDADAEKILRVANVATDDYTDLVGSQLADIDLGKPLKCGQSLYIALVDRTGTNTYTASGIKLRVYLRADNPR